MTTRAKAERAATVVSAACLAVASIMYFRVLTDSALSIWHWLI